MGWRELAAWRREMQRSIKARNEQRETPIGSWEGRDQDAWWGKADETRARLRGQL